MKTYLVQFNRALSEWFCDESNEGILLPFPYGEVHTRGMAVSVYTRGAPQSSAYFMGMCIINKFLKEYEDILPDPPIQKKFRQLKIYTKETK